MPADSIQDSLKRRGLRLTRQRKILLELIDEAGRHLDVERIYALATKRDPRLNRVTVYRTINMLKDAGLIDELDLMHWSGGRHYYEMRPEQEHAHVVCLRCGKVLEFSGPHLKRLRRQVESDLQFEVLNTRTEIGGYCSECRKQPVAQRHSRRAAATAPAASET
jgi:Fur family ferric uptake transcriptional regulator